MLMSPECIQLGAGNLFDYAESSTLSFMGYTGIEAGYMIAFSFCAVAYLASWLAMKAFVPKYLYVRTEKNRTFCTVVKLVFRISTVHFVRWWLKMKQVLWH